jgi:DNA-binding NtrC family response regulator
MAERKTILVVDDDVNVLAAVSACLIDAGYIVLSATGGPRGLERALEFPGDIDVLLSDFRMPGMSGAELAAAIAVQRPGIRVLLMSGYPDRLVLQDQWAFLQKPFRLSKLRAAVAELVCCAGVTESNL